MLGAVDSIYTASNAPFLILSSKVTKGRVKGITHASIKVDTSNVSIAFFSAGTYLSYRHPRDEALEAHSAQGYRCVNDRTSQHIMGTQLLP